MTEHIIQHFLAPNILIRWRLPVQRLPKLIVLRKALLNLVAGKVFLDVGFVAPTIARVSTDPLAKQFLYCGDEWVCFGQIQAAKGDVGGRETACQGRGVV